MQFEILISFGPKYFIKMMIHCEKILRPLYFAQKCPQNAGNGASENQISYRIMSSLLQVGPRNFFCVFFTRCDVFCDLLQYTHTQKNVIYLFYTMYKNSKGSLKDLGGMKKRKTSLLT